MSETAYSVAVFVLFMIGLMMIPMFFVICSMSYEISIEAIDDFKVRRREKAEMKLKKEIP